LVTGDSVKTLRLIGALFVAALLTAAHAGTIAGTVEAVPPTPPAGEGAAGSYASRRYKFVDKLDYEHLTDFVIYIDQLVAPAAGAEPLKVVQRDATFEPHVLPVVVGTTVRWPNEDDIFHNVFSMTETQDFNLGFYKKEKVPEVRFDRLGRVDIFCAIHTNMHGIILVLPNPYFAVADAKRRFVIKNVPAGTYHVKAWHERLPATVRDVVVPAEGEVKINFVLGVAELPKP
jgi:plastocyanin